MFTVSILFLDKNSHFDERKLSAKNMEEFQKKIEDVKEELEYDWKKPVFWRKLNGKRSSTTSLKVIIDEKYEEPFKNFLNDEGVFYEKTRYSNDLHIWKIDVSKDYDQNKIKQLPYVKKIEDMPIIVLD